MRVPGVCCVGLMAVGMSVAQAPAGRVFVHPGVYVSGTQLDFVKAQVKAKAEPFYGEYLKAKASEYGALDYEVEGPPATGVIECGSYGHPDVGCHSELEDATAAYVQALLWYLGGEPRYAENAIRILNAYGYGSKGYALSNAPLQAGWSAEVFPRAAEILRYSHSGWKAEDVAAFAKMLTTVILPLIHDGSGANGNWDLTMIDGMMGIAVFTDDRALMEHAEAMWKERVPAYFYNFELDGAHPRAMPVRLKGQAKWYGTTDLDASVDGISQETCRDLGHTAGGIAAAIGAAETAHIQGDKLYEAEEKRLVAAMEFDAKLMLKKEPVPKLVCEGTVNYAAKPTLVIAYNEYHHRLGVAMPLTGEWVKEHVETMGSPTDRHMMVFEPLTHAEDAGGAGAKP